MTLPLTQLPNVCRLLRTKNSFANYVAHDDHAPWQTGQSTTAVFWCLRTMETAGPDERFAHPTTCQQGRACFRDDF